MPFKIIFGGFALVALTALGCSGSRTGFVESDTGLPSDGGVVADSDAATAGDGDGDLGTIAPTPEDPNANHFGINLQNVSYYAPDWLFADAVKASSFRTTSGSGTLATDAVGWPTQDFQIIFFSDGVYGGAAGVYHLSFAGQATVAGSFTLSNQSYDATTNTTSADAAYGGSGNGYLNFTSTKRTAASAAGSGLTDVRLYKPGYGAGDTFTTPVKSLIAKFAVIRFMDFTATNWSQQVEWSDRTLPTHPSQQIDDPAYGWEGRGAAWEYAIALANETKKDMWINIPVKASDDYVKKLATLIRDGGNGFAPLDPSLRIYVEYSNELWNGGFAQTNTNHDLAVAEVAAGGSPLDYDHINDTGGWTYAWRRIAKRGAEISGIFRSVFGDAQMMTRVRPVLEWQQDQGQGTPMAELTFLDAYYNNGDGQHVATPHPPSWYFWGGGGSGYYYPDNSGTLTSTTIWSSDTMDVGKFATVCQSDVDWTIAYGLRRVAYEGGPSFDKGGPSDAVKDAAWSDPKMTQTFVDHHNAWSANGGDLLVYFQSTGDFQWGFTHDLAALDSPKLKAIDALAAAPRAAVTYGALLPGTLDAAQPSVANQYGGHASNLAPGNWLGYTFRVASDGSYSVSALAKATTAGGLEILVDGQSLGVAMVAVSASDQETTAFPVTLAAGLHSVAIRGRSGSLGVTQLHVK